MEKLAAKVTSVSAGMVFLSSTKLTDRQGRVEVAWPGYGFVTGCGQASLAYLTVATHGLHKEAEKIKERVDTEKTPPPQEPGFSSLLLPSLSHSRPSLCSPCPEGSFDRLVVIYIMRNW